MKYKLPNKSQHGRNRIGWLFEVAIVATTVPAGVYTASLLTDLPIV